MRDLEKESRIPLGSQKERYINNITGRSGISFSKDDRENVQDPNHDGLLIIRHIINLLVKRILIDGGSSANIILLDTLKRIKIPDLGKTLNPRNEGGDLHLSSMRRNPYPLGHNQDHR